MINSFWEIKSSSASAFCTFGHRVKDFTVFPFVFIFVGYLDEDNGRQVYLLSNLSAMFKKNPEPMLNRFENDHTGRSR